MNSNYRSNKSLGITLDAVGHVENVLKGHLPEGTRALSLSPYKAGFEAGSPRDAKSIGEFISFNGIGYSRSTAEHDLGALLVGPTVVTNGAVFLPQGTDSALEIEVVKPTTVAELASQFQKRFDGPVCFLGLVTFDNMRATAITRSPTYGEMIFKHKKKYYRNAPETTGDVRVAIMGCSADMKQPHRAGMTAVLYANPNEGADELTIHTHGLEVSADTRALDDVTEEVALGVHHIFSDSVVSSGRIEVYPIFTIRSVD